MQIYDTVAAMRHACRAVQRKHDEHHFLGLVPTMGALHAGHLSLVQRARRECECVAATIFVNPLQFAPGEDFERYPRDAEADCLLLEAGGVDLLFLPSVEEMYPSGAKSTVDVADLSERLDGAYRPGHFRGVATVVAKLFHIVEPDAAYFGQKDAAQVAVLRQMIRDLNFGVKLIACEIVRDSDGLALSSRNQYLSAVERTEALALPRALTAMQTAIDSGQREPEKVLQIGKDILQQEPGVALEFLQAVDPETLESVPSIVSGTLIAMAAKIGRTRLIDNLLTV